MESVTGQPVESVTGRGGAGSQGRAGVRPFLDAMAVTMGAGVAAATPFVARRWLPSRAGP